MPNEQIRPKKETMTDILTTQNSSEENQNKQESGDTFIREQIPNTPFWLVGNEEKGYIIVMGKHRISDYYQTKEDAELSINTQMWKTILNVIAIMLEDTGKI
jgi:hypothetical protein